MSRLEVETVKKPSLNRSAKDRRNTLFRVLDGVLGLSHKKIHNGGNSDKLKQGWARVLISAVSTYGNLLKDEELELRVLPPVFARDERRMGRFEREAQVLASLNHPNIASIYGLDAGGFRLAQIRHIRCFC